MRPYEFEARGEGKELFQRAIKLCIDMADADNGRNQPLVVTHYAYATKESMAPVKGVSVKVPPMKRWRVVGGTASPGSTMGVFCFPIGEDSVLQPLPLPMGEDALTAMLWHFCQTGPVGPSPDYDGDLVRGWEVSSGSSKGLWHPEPIVLARPYWIIYGK